ncbi:MAG: helix-hairpin-helix domain-containing protein [Planctomycetota bacterium]
MLAEDDILGAGGEATIHGVNPQPMLAAKIWREPRDHAQRLDAMLDMDPPGKRGVEPGHVSVAWPIDALLDSPDEHGRVVGFVMPRVRRAHSVLRYANPGLRREHMPLFSYRYLLRAARNLASAVRELHEAGVVIGDVNESNILVTDTALATLVDADSFQVTDRDGRVWPCPVARPDYTPPELLQAGGNADYGRRTPTHDHFGLAVVLFQLLMEGTHPFAGRERDPAADPTPYDARIASGNWPWSQTRPVQIDPLPLAPPFGTLPPPVQTLFRRAFELGHDDPSVRPDASEWQTALDAAEEELQVCKWNDQHRYSPHLDDCPWCHRMQLLGGRDPFPSRDAVAAGRHLSEAERERLQSDRRAATPDADAPGRLSPPKRPIPARARALINAQKKPTPNNPPVWALSCGVAAFLMFLLATFGGLRGPNHSSPRKTLYPNVSINNPANKPPVVSLPPVNPNPLGPGAATMGASGSYAVRTVRMSADQCQVAWCDAEGACFYWCRNRVDLMELPIDVAVEDVVFGNNDAWLLTSLSSGDVAWWVCPAGGEALPPRLAGREACGTSGPIRCVGTVLTWAAGSRLMQRDLAGDAPATLIADLDEPIVEFDRSPQSIIMRLHDDTVYVSSDEPGRPLPHPTRLTARTVCLAAETGDSLAVFDQVAEMRDSMGQFIRGVRPKDDNRFVGGSISPDGRVVLLATTGGDLMLATRDRNEPLEWLTPMSVRCTSMRVFNGRETLLGDVSGRVLVPDPAVAGRRIALSGVALQPVDPPAKGLGSLPMAFSDNLAYAAIAEGDGLHTFCVNGRPPGTTPDDIAYRLHGGQAVSLAFARNICRAIDASGQRWELIGPGGYPTGSSVSFWSRDVSQSPDGSVVCVVRDGSTHIASDRTTLMTRNGVVALHHGFSSDGAVCWHTTDQPGHANRLLMALPFKDELYDVLAMPRTRVSAVDWHRNGAQPGRILVGCEDGRVWLCTEVPGVTGVPGASARRLVRICQAGPTPVRDVSMVAVPGGSRAIVSVLLTDGTARLFSVDGWTVTSLGTRLTPSAERPFRGAKLVAAPSGDPIWFCASYGVLQSWPVSPRGIGAGPVINYQAKD